MMRRSFLLSLVGVIAAATVGCDSGNGNGEGALPAVSVTLERAFPGLSFVRPVDFQVAPDGSDLIFIVEQAGNVRVFENDPGVTASSVFLGIQSRVSRQDNEEGLLGLAFHPQYAQNGFFFVYYSAAGPRRSIVARYNVSADSRRADDASELILMEILQPFGNHNGGQLQFGPDGYLYVAVGDGGGARDPLGNGQDPRTLLGTILRIDVDRSSGPVNYAIPPDNPFAGNNAGIREEVYAYGLRNPWRFSFDSDTGWLWLADVGQERLEEINIIESGKNYGWATLEGNLCHSPTSGCDQTGKEPPIWVYPRNQGGSVSGGYVYRGNRIQNLRGRYVYGDFLSGRIWALHYDGGQASNELLAQSGFQISGFGRDQAGEIYVLTFDANIQAIVPAE